MIIVTVAIAISLASLLLTSTTLIALPGSIAQAYIVINGGAISGSGQVISSVPLLPALCVGLLTARTTYSLVKTRASMRDLGIIFAAAVGIPFLLTLTATAMLWSASHVFAMGLPPLLTFARVVILHAAAVLAGMGPRLWKALARRYAVPEAWVSSAYAALRLLAVWMVAGFILVAVMTAVRWQPVGHPLVALGYLPNAAIGGASVMLGADFRVGESWVSLFSAHPGVLPPVQWLVAMPESVHTAAAFIMVVAFLVALFVLKDMPEYGLAVAPFTMVGMGILQLLQSGPVGVLGYVGSTWWLAILLAGIYPAAIGLGGVLIRLIRGKRVPAVAENAEQDSAESTAEADDDTETAVSVVDDESASETDGEDGAEDGNDENSVDGDADLTTDAETETADAGENEDTEDTEDTPQEEGKDDEPSGIADSGESVSTDTPARGQQSSELAGDGEQWDVTSETEEEKVTADDDANIPHVAADPHGSGDERHGENDSEEENTSGGSRLWVGNTSPSDDGSAQ
ncbi:MAG: hypothetical protein SPK00_08645 [Corynebacterium glucuronolyticum]|nr:hypothetical protein [Corynebacterium glucuronolyticum]MDD7587109.1 hypothetical protein [Mycobacteriaceae bacterium]MDY5834796.1 hypothetical protein [Corynebacterium glucuronolyticum]